MYLVIIHLSLLTIIHTIIVNIEIKCDEETQCKSLSYISGQATYPLLNGETQHYSATFNVERETTFIIEANTQNHLLYGKVMIIKGYVIIDGYQFDITSSNDYWDKKILSKINH